MNGINSIGKAILRVLVGLALIVAGISQAAAQNVFVTSTPITGATITAFPADSTGATSGVTNFSLTYGAGIVVILTAPANFNGEIFANWTLNGVAQAPGVTTLQFNSAGVNNAVAVYTTPNVALTVASVNPVSGVVIAAAPPDNGALTGGTTAFVLTYPNLTNVTLTAPAGAGGNVFDHWVLGVTSQPQGQLKLNFSLAGAIRATAVYVTPIPVNVASQNPNSGVAIGASPADAGNLSGGTTTFTLNYVPNTIVTLTAPGTAGLNVFANWTLNGVAQPAGQMQLRFTVNAAGPSTAVAIYQTPNYTVTASATGTHGSVSPSGVVTLAAGANQTFTATPSAGYMVKQWVLDGAVAQSGGGTFQVTRITANHTLAVSFSVVIIFHPADTNKDGLMTIAEVTAYGAAWKKGTAWPNAPSPIPASYITNAIMLWKLGEAYTNDPARAFPDSWIPMKQAPQVAKGAASVQVSAASSVATVTIEPDGWWRVNVIVTPTSGTRAYTLEEHLPRGSQVSAISAGGVFDARGLVLRWGPFMDSGIRIFSYRTKTPGALSGSASFDGSVVKTKGDRSIGGKP